MTRSMLLAAVCLGGALAAGGAYAADTNANAQTTQTSADKDFGKLSQDGFDAMRDIRMARLAIFDGNTSQAKTDVDNAASALQKAKSDDSVFTKAESELKAPAGTTQKGEASDAQNTTPVKWLPVDGAFTLGEDYIATPEKKAAIDKANQQMKQGAHDNAMEALKLAHVDVMFDVEVAPLQKTIDGVSKAQSLIESGHYFQANQALKSVEDGTRFDVEDLVGTPKKGTQAG